MKLTLCPAGLSIKSITSLVSILIIFASCGNIKRSTYFYDTSDRTFRAQNVESLEPVLRSNDLLSISVSSVNPEAAAFFNVANVVATKSSTVSGVTTQASGYLIDQEGFIRFPILGKIEAAGKTKKMLREDITVALETAELLIDPIVDVRYLNFKISILGEVKNPKVLTIPNEKVSLFEALGLAGDITIFGNKENVSLIREENGAKILRRLDLTSSTIFNSPYYYLKSNDIVYVESKNSKVIEASLTKQWLPVILSAISLAIITIVQLR